jgi:hypothetical protein
VPGHIDPAIPARIGTSRRKALIEIQGEMMFCPVCGEEYLDEACECAECSVPLVPEAPEGLDARDFELETVLETSDPGLIAVVKSLLEEAGISYWVQDEAMQGLYLTSIFPSRFQVERRYAQLARELLDGL